MPNKNKNCILKNPIPVSKQKVNRRDETIETGLAYISQVLMKSLGNIANTLGGENKLREMKLEVAVTVQPRKMPRLIIDIQDKTPYTIDLPQLRGFPLERLYWLVEKATSQARQGEHYNIWRSDQNAENYSP